MNDFDALIELKRRGGCLVEAAGARVVFAPDLGARVFCELGGVSLHRLDLENVRHPDRPFNNYGGNNFWPAPEGGAFGFNYDGDTWRVQPAVNNQPFELEAAGASGGRAGKRTTLINRKGVGVDVVMRRGFTVVAPPARLAALRPVASLAYTVDDRIDVINRIGPDDALVACWTLEQFSASPTTLSFARVAQPREAINFDFYEHPGDRIAYAEKGFFYTTDSRRRGQIGLRKSHAPDLIGFYDRGRKLLCIREIVGSPHGTYFNIADNDQPRGPFSAEDIYSIFNGDESLGFFELETVGGAEVQEGCLKGSRLASRTSFALFDDVERVEQFIRETIGSREV